MTFQWNEEVKKAWNEMSDRWSRDSQNMWDHGSRKDIIPLLQRHVSGGTFIDIGCGDGYGTHMLKKAGFEAIGIDISADMIAQANAKKVDSTISFQQADVHHLPFQPAQFDGVLAINVLEWTEHPYDVLCELKRVIRPGGIICVGLLGPTAGPRTHSYRRLYGEPVICNTMMPWEWNTLAEENGLTYLDGFCVPKKGMKQVDVSRFSHEIQQAISFMWVAMYEEKEES